RQRMSRPMRGWNGRDRSPIDLPRPTAPWSNPSPRGDGMVPLYRYNLLLDGSLRVETTRELASAVEPWLPWRLPSGSAVPPSPAGLIEVSSGRPTLDEVRQPPILRLGSVTAETTDLDSIVLRGIEGSTTGSIDLTG